MLQLGSVLLKTNVVPAPLAGISDKAFRILAREFGCHLVYTEMISAKALHYKNSNTLELLDLTGEPEPVAVQLFGSEPEVMAEAAKMAVDYGAAIIDINMGCPSPKIVKNGEGAALMQTPKLAFKIVEKVAGSVSVPVTVKMRKGWDKEHVNAIELAKGVVEAGAQALTVHGRTRDQFYTGQADWNIIAQVVAEVEVPVFGNGDILQPQDAARMLEQTKCAGVMIARGSFGNPWIFKRTIAYLAGEELPEPAMEEKIKEALRHLDLVVKFKGEKIGVKEMRKHLAWYIKGGRGAAKAREIINNEEDYEKVKDILVDFLQQQE
jgi:nifR3 family TIM-barrel protein